MKKFKNKAELFAYLVAEKEELIFLKKSVVKFSDPCTLPFTVEKRIHIVDKAKYAYENDEEKGILKRTIVANTYNWLDSHGDVHLNGLFAKSISDGGKKAHLHDHIQQLDGRVGKPLNFSEKEISWRELGQGKTGMTMALLMESEIRKSYNPEVYLDYLNDDIDQHSVGMQYVKLALAINDEENYPNEYKIWKENIGKLGNKNDAEDQGYFWAVSEAKLFETSAVLFGANKLTPTLGSKSQPEKSTVPAEEPHHSTRVLEAVKGLNKQLQTS